MATVPRQREYTPHRLTTEEYERFTQLCLRHRAWAIRYTADQIGPVFEGTRPDGRLLRARTLDELARRLGDGSAAR
ncbi:hypothetical protein [Streptomonospora alba]|nr:hypothetical protein [Streptomonospora alba]